MHIANSYNFDRFSSGFVEILAAEQTLENDKSYEGTADSVRKSFQHFKTQHPTHYIILSGDQLYRMNLKDFMISHLNSGAGISIATTVVNREQASRYGIMKIDETNRITEFKEKPPLNTDISAWKIPQEIKANIPSTSAPANVRINPIPPSISVFPSLPSITVSTGCLYL